MQNELPGKYKSNVKLEVTSPKEETNKIFINIHGLYGLSGDPGSKSELLGNEIINRNLAQVVQYNSSRDWDIFEDGDWDKMQAAFERKTFGDELDDLRTALDYITKPHINIIALGNSLGGMLLSSICSKYPQIKKIILAGAGTGATTSKLPVMNTMTVNQIRSSAENFTGEVLLLQGSADDVVPLEAGDELLTFFTKAKDKDKVVIKNAPHNFKGFYREYIEEITKFIQ